MGMEENVRGESVGPIWKLARRIVSGARRVLREPLVRAREAELLGLLHLHADVAGARAVVTDEHGAQTGGLVRLLELRDAGREVGEDRLGDRGSGQKTGAHGPKP